MSETESDDRDSRSTGNWVNGVMTAGIWLFFAMPPAALATAALEPFVGDLAYLIFAAVLGGFVVAWLVAALFPGGDPGTAIIWVGFLVFALFGGLWSLALLEDSSFFVMIVVAAAATWILFPVLVFLEWAVSPESRAAEREWQQPEDAAREARRREHREPAPWERGLTLSKPRVLAVLVPMVVLGLAMGLVFLAWGISFAFGLGGADKDLAVGVLSIALGAFFLWAAITLAYLFWRAPEEQLRDSAWFWRDTNVSDPDALPGTRWGVVAEAEVSAEVDEPPREPFATATRKDERAGATVLKVVGVIPLAFVGLLFLATGVMAFFDAEDGGVGVGVASIVMGAIPAVLAFVGWRWPRAGGLVLLFPVAFPIGILFAFEAFTLVVFALAPAFSGVAFLAAGLLAHRANRPTSPHPPLTVGPA